MEQPDSELPESIVRKISFVSALFTEYQVESHSGIAIPTSPERGQLLAAVLMLGGRFPTDGPVIDFSRSFLEGYQFDDVDFGRINLTQSSLRFSRFTHCNLSRVTLDHCFLPRGTSLKSTELTVGDETCSLNHAKVFSPNWFNLVGSKLIQKNYHLKKSNRGLMWQVRQSSSL